MTASSVELDACHARVGEALREMYGERLVADATNRAHGIRVGSAWVNVWVRPGPDGRPAVATRAWIVEGAELSQEFLRHLLSEPEGVRYGSFGLDARDVLFVEHSMPADGITAGQMRASVAAVAELADRVDDEIVARFGGIRMTDQRPTSGQGGSP